MHGMNNIKYASIIMGTKIVTSGFKGFDRVRTSPKG